MATKVDDRTELEDIEATALQHLEDEALPTEVLPPLEPDEAEGPLPVGRLSIVVGLSSAAAAAMVGGIFKGVSPRLWAMVAALLGIGLAAGMLKVKSPVLMNILAAVGVVMIGVVLTIPAGTFSDVINPGPFVKEAVLEHSLLRPPVEFTFGWRAIVGWIMGGVAFSAAWIAFQLRRPALALLAPTVLIAFGAISVPDDQKLTTGLVSLALFATGLGVLSGIDVGESEQRSIGYELRRAAKAIPLVGVITAAIWFGAQTGRIFPPPRFDPTQDAQKPKTVPIAQVPDRVLFTVQSTITGPWRMGGLDVYKDDNWLLPPFKDNRITEVPSSGIIDRELQPGVKARFSIRGLSGTVLPGLPNLVGLVAEGPVLAYDRRTGNIRMGEGTVQEGLEYTVTAARIPTVEELRNVQMIVPQEAKPFLTMPPPPPAVEALLREAPTDNAWNKLDFVRTRFLERVVATGLGTPKSVPPSKVQDMLAGSKEGTPYEIVAGQAMLARWAGVPARIGYGFDGGDKVDNGFEVRPKHGASFLEVYFPGYKWLPIIGTPLQAKSSTGGQFTQQNDQVIASEDISVKVFVPFETNPRTYLFEQIRRVVLVVVPIILLILAIYFSFPALRKAVHRSRLRTWAQREGVRARIAVAYAEWRDLATDFGYRYTSDTPLMFLDRVVPDEEHTELAWLVTRTLWGDLQEALQAEDATAAEELSRSLRKRMNQAHTVTLRTIAAVSRLSLKHPYSPNLGVQRQKKGKRARHVPAEVSAAG